MNTYSISVHTIQCGFHYCVFDHICVYIFHAYLCIQNANGHTYMRSNMHKWSRGFMHTQMHRLDSLCAFLYASAQCFMIGYKPPYPLVTMNIMIIHMPYKHNKQYSRSIILFQGDNCQIIAVIINYHIIIVSIVLAWFIKVLYSCLL